MLWLAFRPGSRQNCPPKGLQSHPQCPEDPEPSTSGSATRLTRSCGRFRRGWRGLHIVQALSALWGWAPQKTGKAVYAILAMES